MIIFSLGSKAFILNCLIISGFKLPNDVPPKFAVLCAVLIDLSPLLFLQLYLYFFLVLLILHFHIHFLVHSLILELMLVGISLISVQ